MESLDDIMAKLPPEHQQEVRDFALFLAEKRAKPKRRRLRLNWAGGPQRVPRSIYISGATEEVAGLVGRLMLMYLVETNVCMARTTSITTKSKRGAPVPGIG